MSTIIIITQPKRPAAAQIDSERTGASPPQPYDEIRDLIDQAEAEGSKVRVINTD